MTKQGTKKSIKQNSANNLQLSGRMYLLLLAAQLLNLLTLVQQLHFIYLVVAVALLLIQFISHYKIRKNLTVFQQKGFAPLKPLSSTEKSLTESASASANLAAFYSVPKILPAWLVFVFAITGSITLAISGRDMGLLLSMVHLLCFAYSLKIFEMPRRKDLYQLVVLGMFIATSSLIFYQSVYFSIAVILLVFANLVVLLVFYAPTIALKQQMKTLIKLMFYTLPLAIALFIGFPKLTPFWQVPSVESAKIGLSDRVKVGDIAQLALSDELAFRVSFNSDMPAHSQQYWRALVLDDFDGDTWQQTNVDRLKAANPRLNDRRNEQVNVDIQGVGVSYQVITEPSFQSWLFALDFATSEQAKIAQRSDFSLYYRGIVNQTLSYNVTSYPDTILSRTLSATERNLNLLLPATSNPRLTEKGQQLRNQYIDNQQLINAVLADFNQQQYFYTLQPPRLNGATLDRFYFDSKAGFCEHYASAFTYLMRAAGIPARMVVGYLGGEVNPNGNYLSVYQRNAHAWSEVWLADQGWVRVDPTAAVDSERVERGFSSSLLSEYNELSSGLFSFQAIKASKLYFQIRQQLEALDYQWTRWVIGYTGQRQNEVVKRILAALPSLQSLVLILAGTVSLIFMIVFVRAFLKKNHEQSVWQKQYTNLVAILAKQNIVKAKSMTAMQFASEVAKHRPEIADKFNSLSHYYYQLQYQLVNEIPKNMTASQKTNVLTAENNSKLDSKMQHRQQIYRKYSQCYRELRWQLFLAKLTFK